MSKKKPTVTDPTKDVKFLLGDKETHSRNFNELADASLIIANNFAAAGLEPLNYCTNHDLGEDHKYGGDYMVALGKLRALRELAKHLAREAHNLHETFKGAAKNDFSL